MKQVSAKRGNNMYPHSNSVHFVSRLLQHHASQDYTNSLLSVLSRNISLFNVFTYEEISDESKRHTLLHSKLFNPAATRFHTVSDTIYSVSNISLFSFCVLLTLPSKRLLDCLQISSQTTELRGKMNQSPKH